MDIQREHVYPEAPSMKVAKWGNSLAVRLPADLVKQLGLKEGDEIELVRSAEGALEVSLDQRRQRAIERMRALSVPMPADFKFNREELYERGDREPRYWETDKESDNGNDTRAGDQGAAAD
jgi:antitoxin MazE